jgi:hypothetical protein
MRLMNEDFPTFGMPTIIILTGCPDIPFFSRRSRSSDRNILHGRKKRFQPFSAAAVGGIAGIPPDA